MIYKTLVKMVEVNSIDEINELDNLEEEEKQERGCSCFYARNVFQVIPTGKGYQVFYKVELVNIV